MNITHDLCEDDVKRHLQAWLVSAGWKVEVNMGKVRGVDVRAERDGSIWLIEAKGCGSSDQMKANYFLAVLGTLLKRMDDPSVQYSMAFPDLPQFRRHWERLPQLAKDRTGISVLFVEADGQVTHLNYNGFSDSTATTP